MKQEKFLLLLGYWQLTVLYINIYFPSYTLFVLMYSYSFFIGETYPLRPPSISTLDSNSSSITSSIPDLDRAIDDLHLTTNTDMLTIVRAMARPESGLEIRDRLWLKITIPNAFIGSYKLYFKLRYHLHANILTRFYSYII